VKIVILCYANTCRSPVIEALLSEKLTLQGGFEIVARGLEGHTGETPLAMQRALDDVGIQLKSPSGERVQSQDLITADLILFADRELLREGVVANHLIWSHSFTFREFVRRSYLNPPQPESETFVEWLQVLHQGRDRSDLLGASDMDDVADPGIYGSYEDFCEMIRVISREVAALTPLLLTWQSKLS
jgi:protein-tyrosine-phosphatase